MAIPKLIGTETEATLSVKDRRSSAEFQGNVYEVVSLLWTFASNNRVSPIGGRREFENIAALENEIKNVYGYTARRLVTIEEIKEAIRRLGSKVFFSPIEGLVLENGARAYMEPAGADPEWSTPVCLLPSEVLMQERMLECAFAKSARQLSDDKQEIRLYKNASDGQGQDRKSVV